MLVRAISSSSGSAAARRPFYFFVGGQRQRRSDQSFVLWLIILRFELGKCACQARYCRFSCSRAGLRLRLFPLAGNFPAPYCKNDAEQFFRPIKVLRSADITDYLKKQKNLDSRCLFWSVLLSVRVSSCRWHLLRFYPESWWVQSCLILMQSLIKADDDDDVVDI